MAQNRELKGTERAPAEGKCDDNLAAREGLGARTLADVKKASQSGPCGIEQSQDSAMDSKAPALSVSDLGDLLTSAGGAAGEKFAKLQKANPVMAAAVEQVRTSLKGLSETERQGNIEVLNKLFHTFSGRETDNAMSRKALNQAILAHPDVLIATATKAKEIAGLPKEKQKAQINDFDKGIREFYLD